MQFSIIALLAGVAAAQYSNGTAYTTQVVTSYTTYCPAPTTVVQNNKTYVVTKATTLTITNCPCTVTVPVTKPASSSQWVWSTTVAPVISGSPAPSMPANATSTKPAQFTGAAAANGAAAGLVGIAALFAAAL